MSNGGFAIIDFETTGLFSGGHDRVVEVAVVHTDSSGTVTGSWETLVNPGRDLGRQDIHGIAAAQILNAPTFEQIAPRLVELLSGRVIVAHNARFDTSFLLAELDRAAYQLDLEPVSLCTMRLAREYIPGAGRSLADCCAAFDIELDGAHRASVDALATARLLAEYIALSGDPQYWRDLVAGAAELVWPPLAVVDVEWLVRESAEPVPVSFLNRIAARMHDHSGPDEHHEYLALLDRCLLDRRISRHEAAALIGLAEQLRIGREVCSQLHRAYFEDLLGVAWSDGRLTGDEIHDLRTVAELLEVDADAVRACLSAPAPAVVVESHVASFRLATGDLVVLTGEMRRPRDAWSAELRQRGYATSSGVTKKVKLVVAADPDSLSGKARKARDYGIPIVDEAGLVALLG